MTSITDKDLALEDSPNNILQEITSLFKVFKLALMSKDHSFDHSAVWKNNLAQHMEMLVLAMYFKQIPGINEILQCPTKVPG